MTLTELKYIVAVAREKHFGKAAEACFVSQPTLSVAIKKLEEELDVKIFERGASEIAVTPLGDETEDGWEGCLSVPGLRGLVPRHRRLRYRGVDLEGRLIDRTVEGFHARVVQHEVDHLDGILYPMRLRSLDDLGYEDTLFPKGAALPPD